MAYSLEPILGEMFSREASDLYLTVGMPPVLRVKGNFVLLEGDRLSPDAAQKIVYSFLTDEQREVFEREWELDLSFGLEGKARIRANVFRQRGTVAAVLRMIPSKVPTLEQLGVPKAVGSILDYPKGLVLVSGATGSGKSTTLASMIDQINEREHLHIITIEDPIEFIHPHKNSIVNQREVGQDTETFASALKYALREDPDVVLVGEMRDLETIESALTIAETGHLVFATLHTPDAIQAINRVIDVFPAHQQPQIRAQLSFVLQAVVCQQLLPRADEPGQALAAEVLLLTPAIRNLIREEKIHQIYSLMQTGTEMGMQTMNMALAALVKGRKVMRDEAFSRTSDVMELENMLRGK